MTRLSYVYIVLLGLEFAIAATALVLFGLAYPDRFRTKLWENGGVEGWNSNPNKRIYYYANHREPPEIPLIWSQRLTDSNLAIALLSFVIFFARAIMSYLDYLPRYAKVMYDLLLSFLWIVSLVGQNSGDFSVPEHASVHPWYLTRGCAASWDANRGYCRMARASFVVSILAVILYGGRVVLEALVAAYYRGRGDSRKWVDKSVDEEKYSDEERESSVGLTVPNDWYDQGLSPVLAFFPSDIREHVR